MPLFSIIVPTYNRLALLSQTLASVRAQRFTDYEVIVVDDGSTDGTLAALQVMGCNVRSVRQRNAGPAAARNVGAGHATGTYLAFLDSDDLWFPWTLDALAKAVADHAMPSILASSLVRFTASNDVDHVSEAPLHSESFVDYFSSYRARYFVGAGMTTVRRDRFLQVGGFSAGRNNAEDHDLILRLGTAPGFVQITSPVMLAWRCHPENATADVRDTYEGCIRMIKREQAGFYPGGAARKAERRGILTVHLRPASLACLREGFSSEAWRLYGLTVPWHIRAWRWKYLLGFPLYAVLFSAILSVLRGLKRPKG